MSDTRTTKIDLGKYWFGMYAFATSKDPDPNWDDSKQAGYSDCKYAHEHGALIFNMNAYDIYRFVHGEDYRA